MEACGGAQHWARELRKLGHEVRLLDGKEVSKFVTRNKSDAIDARAIWQAMQQSTVRFVPVKTELQQAVLALHSMRRQLVKIRTMQLNALRGLLTEYGEVFARGRKALTQGLPAALERVAMRLPQAVIDTLRMLWQRVGQLDQEVAQIERSLRQMLAQDPLAQRFLRDARHRPAGRNGLQRFDRGRTQLSLRQELLSFAGHRAAPHRLGRQE